MRKTEEEIQKELADMYRRDRERSLTDRKRIPADFMQPIRKGFEQMDYFSIREVLSWDGRRSIFAKGQSQCGKSRSLYQVLKRHYVEHGVSFIAMDEFDLMARVRGAESKRDGIEGLLEKLCGIGVLFLDDLDKVSVTSGVRAEELRVLIFSVLKKRQADRLPTFIAMNTAMTEFFAPAGPAIVESIRCRMMDTEAWQIVQFKKQGGAE